MDREQIKVSLFRAGDIGDIKPTPEVQIQITEPVPDYDSMDEWRNICRGQALSLCNALLSSLPGGVIDELFAELARRQASLFSIPHQGIDK